MGVCFRPCRNVPDVLSEGVLVEGSMASSVPSATVYRLLTFWDSVSPYVKQGEENPLRLYTVAVANSFGHVLSHSGDWVISGAGRWEARLSAHSEQLSSLVDIVPFKSTVRPEQGLGGIWDHHTDLHNHR